MKNVTVPTELHHDKQRTIIAGLKNGLGLTLSSQMVGIPVKLVSAFMHENPDYKNECQESITYAAKVLMVLSNEYLQDKNFAKWKENNQFIKQFVANLNTWECYCKKEDVDPKKIILALSIYKSSDESATACGLTKEEYTVFLLENPRISAYLTAHEMML